jgi:hypothetical protein
MVRRVDGDTLRIIVLSLLGVAGAAWLLSTFIFRVSGTWERVLSQEEIDEGVRPERVTLAQLGPLVTGRRDVKGGHQEYSGIIVGRSVRLSRRDHGVASLVALGFPEGVAKKLDGEVMARLRLSLVDGGLFLDGTFEPQKVEFTHQPPRVTSMHFLPAQKRRYRRVEPLEERVPALEEQAEATEA